MSSTILQTTFYFISSHWKIQNPLKRLVNSVIVMRRAVKMTSGVVFRMINDNAMMIIIMMTMMVA